LEKHHEQSKTLAISLHLLKYLKLVVRFKIITVYSPVQGAILKTNIIKFSALINEYKYQNKWFHLQKRNWKNSVYWTCACWGILRAKKAATLRGKEILTSRKWNRNWHVHQRTRRLLAGYIRVAMLESTFCYWYDRRFTV